MFSCSDSISCLQLVNQHLENLTYSISHQLDQNPFRIQVLVVLYLLIFVLTLFLFFILYLKFKYSQNDQLRLLIDAEA